MNSWPPRVARVAIIHALAGWVAAVLLIASDANHGPVDGVLSGDAIRAAGIAAVAGALFTPLLAARRVRWYLGAPVGLFSGLLTLYVFFFLFPHAWQASRLEAWKTISVMLVVYWPTLAPAAVLAGAASAWWASRPVRERGWTALHDDSHDPASPPAG